MNNIDQMVENLYVGLEYRPCVVPVIYDDNKRFLITQASVELSCWSYPQGGIKRGEKIIDALFRELKEEVGINSRLDLNFIDYNLYYAILNFESDRLRKKGFTKGKAYFFVLANYFGDKKLVLNSKEVADAKWLNYSEAAEHFYLGRKEKADLNKLVLDKAINLI